MVNRTIIGCLFAWMLISATWAQPLSRVSPEQVGLNSQQLQYADQAIQSAIAEKQIPGAVLAVVRHGQMAYLKAYGNRSVEPKVEPMTVETVFDMASCSKPMGTAMCVWKLVEQGRLRLLDPVERYIPGFKSWTSADGKSSTTIRVHHLLSHSSGLPPYASVADLQKKYGEASPKVLLDYICSSRRDFEPASDFQYSCLNYITLQHIVENITHKSLRQFAHDNIFGPLGMNHTDYLPCQLNSQTGNWETIDPPVWANLIAPTEKQANGQVLRGQVHDPLARVMNKGISGNAGVFTSADDIAILCAMLQNGGVWNGQRIFSPLTVRAMRTVPREETSLGRTLGWDCYSPYASNNGDLLSPETYSHTGYTGTSIVIDPVNDLSVILLTNAVHPHDKTNVIRLRSIVSNAVAASVKAPGDTVQKHTAHYDKRIAQFNEETPILHSDIVMLGNSLTENGGDWADRLGKKGIRNRGIIGDDVQGVADRLYQILPYRPAKIFLMIGINDVSHNLTADSIVTLIARTVEQIRTQSPTTELYLQSLLPINEDFHRYKRLEGKTGMVPEINQKLKDLASEQKITFIDLYPDFCEKKTDKLRSDWTADGLHLKEAGYRMWAKHLKPFLR